MDTLNVPFFLGCLDLYANGMESNKIKSLFTVNQIESNQIKSNYEKSVFQSEKGFENLLLNCCKNHTMTLTGAFEI